MTEKKMQNEITRLLKLLAKNPDLLNDIAKRMLFLAKTGVLPPKHYKNEPAKDYELEEIKEEKRWKDFSLKNSLSAKYFNVKGEGSDKEDDDVKVCNESMSFSMAFDKGSLVTSVVGAKSGSDYSFSAEFVEPEGDPKTDGATVNSTMTDGSSTDVLGLEADTNYYLSVTVTDNKSECVWCFTDIVKGWSASSDGDVLTLTDKNKQSCKSLAEALGGGK